MRIDHTNCQVYLCSNRELFAVDACTLPTMSTLPNDPKPDFTLHELRGFAHLLMKGI